MLSVCCCADMFRYDVVKADRLHYLTVFGSSISEIGHQVEGLRTWAHRGERVGDFTRIKVTYEQQKGRMYAVGSSLQNMKKAVRNFLLPDNAMDIDIVNAAPTIILSLCELYNIASINLVDFVENYEARMQELADSGCVDPKKEKMYILFGSDNAVRQESPHWVDILRRELKYVSEQLRPHEEDLWLQAEAADREDREQFRLKRRRDAAVYQQNVHGKFLAYVYFKYEWATLHALDSIGQEANFWGDETSLLFDGLIIQPLRLHEDVDVHLLEERLRIRMFDRLRLKVKSTTVPMLQLATPENLIVSTNGMHNEAADIIIHKLNGTAVRSGITKYMKLNGVWTDQPKLVEEGMTRYVMTSNIMLNRIGKDGESTIVGFSCDRRHAKLIASAVLERLDENPTFGKQLVLGSMGKLAFLNGYWQFTDEAHDDIYGHFVRDGEFPTGAMIPINFPPYVEEDVAFVMDRILIPPFDGSQESLDVLLKAMARALAGCVDKMTYIIVGPRNSGKSVIFQFLEGTIGNYCSILPSSILLARSGTDTFRDNNWIFALEMGRICRISEGKTVDAKETILSGNELKVFQSMKEGVRSRRIYGSDRDAYSLATGFILVNDVPRFDPPDALDQCVIITVPNRFVPREEKARPPACFIETYKIAEPAIEAWIQDTRYQAAFLHILLRHYRPEVVQPTAAMLETRDEILQSTGPAMYHEILDFTLDASDKVKTTDVERRINANGRDGPRLGSATIRRNIQDIVDQLCAEQHVARFDIKCFIGNGHRAGRARGYKGMRMKEEDNQVVQDDDGMVAGFFGN